MRMKYISRIMSGLKKYKVIYTNRSTSRVLDGSYKSVYKGRSMNFDDLREFSQGDDVKDVDWKASARSRKLLIREYIAEKKHNLMMIMDTNKRMLGETKDGQEKREVALLSAGTLAYLVNRNGDYVASVYMDKGKARSIPFKTGLPNVEELLTKYNKSVDVENTSEINEALDYVVRNYKRRMIIVIFSDIQGFLGISEEVLRRLLTVHDVLAVNISDNDIYGSQVFDIDNDSYLPDYLSKNEKIKKMYFKEMQEVYDKATYKLKKNGVVYTTINGINEISTRIIELLEKHRLEKR